LKQFNYFWLKFVKVDIENPLALNFLMQDELYLLNNDKNLHSKQAFAGREIISVPHEAIVPVAADLTYYGNNKNGLLVLVHYAGEEFIAEAHLTALANILSRKGLALPDAAILNMHTHNKADFEGITSYFNPQKTLILGKKAMPTGLPPINLNQLQQMGAVNALYSYSFDEMMDNNENKKAFWEQMKLL
jgi:hypothetical protein